MNYSEQLEAIIDLCKRLVCNNASLILKEIEEIVKRDGSNDLIRIIDQAKEKHPENIYKQVVEIERKISRLLLNKCQRNIYDKRVEENKKFENLQGLISKGKP